MVRVLNSLVFGATVIGGKKLLLCHFKVTEIFKKWICIFSSGFSVYLMPWWKQIATVKFEIFKGKNMALKFFWTQGYRTKESNFSTTALWKDSWNKCRLWRGWVLLLRTRKYRLLSTVLGLRRWPIGINRTKSLGHHFFCFLDIYIDELKIPSSM